MNSLSDDRRGGIWIEAGRQPEITVLVCYCFLTPRPSTFGWARVDPIMGPFFSASPAILHIAALKNKNKTKWTKKLVLTHKI